MTLDQLIAQRVKRAENTQRQLDAKLHRYEHGFSEYIAMFHDMLVEYKAKNRVGWSGSDSFEYNPSAATRATLENVLKTYSNRIPVLISPVLWTNFSRVNEMITQLKALHKLLGEVWSLHESHEHDMMTIHQARLHYNETRR